MTRVLKGIGRHFEVLIAVLALAFRESQRDSDIPGGLEPLAPETFGNLDRGKLDRSYGITSSRSLSGGGIAGRCQQSGNDSSNEDIGYLSHKELVIFYLFFYKEITGYSHHSQGKSG